MFMCMCHVHVHVHVLCAMHVPCPCPCSMYLEAEDLGYTDGAIEVDVERAEYLSNMHRLQT